MSLVDGIYNNIESLFAWASLGLKQSILSYCNLETADDENTLVTKSGDLLSIIRLDGYQRFIGNEEFDFVCQRLLEIIQPAFSGSGHTLQFFFSYDKANIGKIIKNAQVASRATAKHLNLDIDDIFDSRVKTLSSICAEEQCYIVVWTGSSAMNKTHLKQVRKRHLAGLKKIKLPKLTFTQNLFLVLPEVRNLHQSFVTTVVEDIQRTGYYATLLSAHEAVHCARQSIDPDFTSDSWTPFLPGDKLPKRIRPDGDSDLADILWPPLDGQVIPRGGKNLDLYTAQIGDRIYAPLYIELFPKDIKPFYDLFRRMLPAEMPWRISYFLESGGMKIVQSKAMLAKFLAFSSHYNKLLVESHQYLKQIQERSDDPIIALNVVLATWAPANKPDLLKERVAKLAKIVQGWGGCDTRRISGDAMGTTLSSALAINHRVVATATAAPLSDTVKMMPLVRPASPWSEGAMLFRTPDGKLWPYQPGSSHQISWVDIIYARSGSGKSVLLNSLNLGLCLSPGLNMLPRVSIVDIGPSSKGFISLLKEGLPDDKKHQVLYHRLRLEPQDAINPFDTQLGARYPTKLHRSFLINFLSLLLVDDIQENPPEGIASMLSMIVDETYRRFSDVEHPKMFVAHLEPEVQSKLDELGFEGDGKEIWWQVADFLFSKDEKVLALKAQRHALPTIADTVSIAHSQSIRDLFGEVKTTTEEDYVSYFCRIISAVIRNFPTLTAVTRMNLEGARVIALDLDEVAKTGSTSADKQTAIMYMLARHVLGQHFFLNISEVEQFPKAYQAYHAKRVKEIMEEPKRLVFDEFHRTSKSSAVREQVIQDMREGRKWKIHISLASQSLVDFDALMIEFATSIFILDAGPQVTINKTCEIFGLSETERLALSTRVHGPTSRGATFIAQFVTKRGLNTQLLTSTISPVELWAFTTTTEDVSIRDTLYQLIGPVATRHLLAERFPNGSAAEEISAEIKMKSKTTVSEICQQFVEELMLLHKKRQRARQLKGR